MKLDAELDVGDKFKWRLSDVVFTVVGYKYNEYLDMYYYLCKNTEDNRITHHPVKDIDGEIKYGRYVKVYG